MEIRLGCAGFNALRSRSATYTKQNWTSLLHLSTATSNQEFETTSYRQKDRKVTSAPSSTGTGAFASPIRYLQQCFMSLHRMHCSCLPPKKLQRDCMAGVELFDWKTECIADRVRCSGIALCAETQRPTVATSMHSTGA
jgi:hypothetical protein